MQYTSLLHKPLYVKLSAGVFLAALVLMLASCGNRNKADFYPNANDTLRGNIQISGAFALYPLAVKWAGEFRKLHPNVQIDISAGGSGKGITDVLAGMVDVGMVSRNLNASEAERGAVAVVVVRDAVVITANADNPNIEYIRKHGLSLDQIKRIWTGEATKWSDIYPKAGLHIHAFTRSDVCGAAETFAEAINLHQEDLEVVGVYGDPGVAVAVQRDKVALGYNNLAYVYSGKTKRPFEGLEVVPIDFNDDGVITKDEDFYGHLDSLAAAIRDGRYKEPPVRHLYFVTKGDVNQGSNQAAREFISFVLGAGQPLADKMGFVSLSAGENSN